MIRRMLRSYIAEKQSNVTTWRKWVDDNQDAKETLLYAVYVLAIEWEDLKRAIAEALLE